MGKAKLILGLVVLAMAVVAGWPIAWCELANLELREDLRDIAAQNAVRIGLAPPSTDEYLRSTVVRAAKEHEIQLEPEQVTLHRTATAPPPILTLSANSNSHRNL